MCNEKLKTRFFVTKPITIYIYIGGFLLLLHGTLSTLIRRADTVCSNDNLEGRITPYRKVFN